MAEYQQGPPPAGEVNIDGNTFSSDGGGNMSFDGADGAHGEMGADGGASYQGPEGSGISGQMNPDGSGSWTGSDGNTTSWEAGEAPPTDLPGMEALPDMGEVANSPEAMEAFGPPAPGMMDGEPGIGPMHGDMEGVAGDVTGVTGDMTGVTGDVSAVTGDMGPVSGDVSGVTGDMTGCEGDVSGVTGDMTGCEGDMTGVTGDMTAMSGDMTGVEGQPPAEMMGEGDQGMAAMDEAFADDGTDKGTPPPTDDPMGVVIDQAAAQDAASSMPEAGQGAPDTMAEVGLQDDGIPKEDEDDQSGSAAG